MTTTEPRAQNAFFMGPAQQTAALEHVRHSLERTISAARALHALQADLVPADPFTLNDAWATFKGHGFQLFLKLRAGSPAHISENSDAFLALDELIDSFLDEIYHNWATKLFWPPASMNADDWHVFFAAVRARISGQNTRRFCRGLSSRFAGTSEQQWTDRVEYYSRHIWPHWARTLQRYPDGHAHPPRI